MAFLLGVLVACFAACSAQILAPSPLALRSPLGLARSGLLAPGLVAHAPLAVAHAAVDEYDPHPQYSYSYDVHDALTGDSKSQSESRDGDVVHGSYSLVEPDGSLRVVDYTADPINGFNAAVHKEPAAHAIAAHAPVIAHAPIAVAHAPIASPLLARSILG